MIQQKAESVIPDLAKKVKKHALEHKGYTFVKMLNEDEFGFEQQVLSQDGQQLTRKVLFLKTLNEDGKQFVEFLRENGESM